MSQYSTEMEWSFDGGWTWIGVLQITATAQMRRKVIAEQGSRTSGQPSFTIQLDYRDCLSLVITDRGKVRAATNPIPPDKFAFRIVPIIAEIICDPFDTGTSERTLRATLSIGSEFTTDELIVTGDFGGEVERGASSVGASLSVADPATFSVYEIISVGRAPLTRHEKDSIAEYLNEKHQLGDQNG